MSTPARGSRRRLSSFRVIVVSAVLALLAAALGALSIANASVPSPPSGWSTVWSDDFNGAAGSLPSSNDWIIDTGHSYPGGPANWGTGEIQNYTNDPSNVSLDGGGNLNITPIKDGSGNWTSARIETSRSDFQPAAGGKLRIEARIQMPNVTGNQALGYWPAFWTLGAGLRGNYGNWPSIGEFDIMENVNGINSVWGTLHCGVTPGGPCNENNGIGNHRECPNTTCQSAFHNYTFEWDRSSSPETLRWYVDGVQYHSLDASQMDATTWANATHHGHFILLNVAMGGAFPDGVNGSTTPTAATVSGRPMRVDYVTVLSNSGGTDAYSTIQAEGYSDQSGIQTENTSDTGGGLNIGWISDGDWARYSGVNFGSTGAAQFKARVASGAASGVDGLVEVRLDSRSNAPIGSVSVANTGGWQSWQTLSANVSGVTGTHDVYLTFRSGQTSDFANVNWFTFSASGGTGTDAYSTIQAEGYSDQSGIQTENTSDTGGGLNIAWISDGDWARYSGVNFGSTGAAQFKARVASGAASGVSGLVEVRLDSRSNAPIGSVSVANTGGWQSWQTVPANVSGVTGTHDVYLTFRSGQTSDFANVNWFTFSKT